MAVTTPTSLLNITPTTQDPAAPPAATSPPPAPKTPTPKTPTPAPAPSPTYSFLNGTTYNSQEKQVPPPTVVTAKPAVTNLNNQQSALTQATTAQQQQAQTIAQNQQAQANNQVQTPTQNNETQAPGQGTQTTDTTQPSNDFSNITDAENQQLSGINTAIAQVQSESDSALATFQNQISQLQSGTFPLTPAQQAQVTATQQSFASLVQAQQIANANFEGQVRLSGLSGVAPSINLGLINEAVSVGIQKVADIDSQASDAIAKLQEGFATEDYQLINDSYTAASKAFSDKTTALNDMAANVRDAATQAVQIQQDQISNALNSQKLSDDEKNQLFTQSMQSAQFTETQKQDMEKDYYDGVTASQNAEKIGLQQEQINATLATNSLLAAGAATQTTSGKIYVDGTGLTADQKAQALAQGQIVLDGDNAKAMSGINNVSSSFGSLLSSLQQAGVLNQNWQMSITPGSAGFLNKGGTNGFINYWAAGSAVPAVQSFNSDVTAIVKELQALPNTGSLVQALQTNTFNLSKLGADNATQFQTKLTNLGQAIDNAENTLLTQGMKVDNSSVPAGMSLVYSPNGTPGYIPQSQVQAALSQGYNQ
jgi:hypothetical protein